MMSEIGHAKNQFRDNEETSSYISPRGVRTQLNLTYLHSFLTLDDKYTKLVHATKFLGKHAWDVVK